jgi:hypothetical protein
MRKVNEIILVVVAAGLAAAVALVDIPTHSAAPGTVVGGPDFAAPPPISDPIVPPLPPLLFPPGTSTPAPTEPPATPAPSPALGAEPPHGVTKASSPASGVLGTALVKQAPSPAPEPPPAAKKPKPNPPDPQKPEPPPAAEKPEPKPKKPKPPPAAEKPEPKIKPKDRRNNTADGQDQGVRS